MKTELHDILGYDLSDGFWVGYEVSDMRIKCPCCGEKATVYSRAASSSEVASVYAKCTNAACDKFDHSFVSHVAFSHWIEPEAAAVQNAFLFLFDQLPAQHQKELIKQLQA